MGTDTMTISKSRAMAFLWIGGAYFLALAAGFLAGRAFHELDYHPLVVIGVADAVGTLVVFGFSYVFKNSSFYDPYWSVIPVPIAAYLAWLGMEGGGDAVRMAVVLAVVGLWAIRLTSNWARGWQGLHHEDWRYTMLARQTGRYYWLVSFAGIHFFPTIMVFLGCLPLLPALAMANAPFGFLDMIGAIVAITGIGFEYISDNQRYQWASDPANKGKVLTEGMWGWSRHPNYFGEVTFWAGLFILGLAADLSYWWTAIGCVAMWAMFHFISLPMMEKRQMERKPGYAAATRGVSRFWPRPRLK
ncbi:MAG: DUF1295 domain-containing protein [Saprospirales bacterium]|nr:DUF1295 domain-containing protein [Saprospirales bacterium]